MFPLQIPRTDMYAALTMAVAFSLDSHYFADSVTNILILELQ